MVSVAPIKTVLSEKRRRGRTVVLEIDRTNCDLLVCRQNKFVTRVMDSNVDRGRLAYAYGADRFFRRRPGPRHKGSRI